MFLILGITLFILFYICILSLSLVISRPKVIPGTNNWFRAKEFLHEEIENTGISYLAVFGETSPYYLCSLLDVFRKYVSSEIEYKLIFGQTLYVRTREDKDKIIEFLTIKPFKIYKHNGPLDFHFRIVDEDYVYSEEKHPVGQEEKRFTKFINNTLVTETFKERFNKLVTESEEVTDFNSTFSIEVRDFKKDREPSEC